MHDGMPYGRNQGQGQGHSREVDRQSPTGLIFFVFFSVLCFCHIHVHKAVSGRIKFQIHTNIREHLGLNSLKRPDVCMILDPKGSIVDPLRSLGFKSEYQRHEYRGATSVEG